MGIASRLLVAVGSMALLTAASWPTQLPAPRAMAARSYTLVDQRQPKQLKSGFESLMITNCAYGIMRVGDNDIDPHLVVLLDAALGQRFGNKLMGRTITLRGFSVHLNNALASRRNVSAAYGPGLADDLLNKKKVGCAPEDLMGGYTVGEVPPGMAPVVVAVEVEIDGKRYFGRGVAESGQPFPPRKKAGKAEKDAWNATVGKVLEAALIQLGDRMEEGLFGPWGVESGPPAETTARPSGADQ